VGAAIENFDELSAALLIAVVPAEVLAVAIALAAGFIGGPVMPSLFIGDTAGLAIHVLIPEIPLALALSAMLVAVPGVSVGAPFSMVLVVVPNRWRRCCQCRRGWGCGGNRVNGDHRLGDAG
jgi:H+/Cl- antiporter ClcA